MARDITPDETMISRNLERYAPSGDAPFSEDPDTDPRIEGARVVPPRWARSNPSEIRRNIRNLLRFPRR